MDNFYVYIYLRSKNSKHGVIGMPYYVGKGRGNRAYSKQHSIPIPADRANIVIVFSGFSESAAFEEEKRLIAQYGRIDNGTGCLQNRTEGGEGGGCGHHYGRNQTSFKPGHQHSPEVCAKLSVYAKERMTPEMRAQISAKLKEVGAGAPFGNKHFAGHTHTAETREKMSQVQRGRKVSEKSRARMRVAARERCTPEVRVRMAESQRRRFETAMLEQTRLKMAVAQRVRRERELVNQQEPPLRGLSAA
jgi:hypothetical protein